MTDSLPRSLRPLGLASLLLVLLALPAGAQLQTQHVEGVVRALETSAPLEGVTVRVQGGESTTVTDAQGRFLLRDVPSGVWTLEVISDEFGARTYAMEVDSGDLARVEINLERDTRPAVGEGRSTRPAAEGPMAGLGQTVAGDALRRAASGARNLGELIQQAVPAFRARSSVAVAGTDNICLEFRSRGASSLRPEGEPDAMAVYCQHPRVYLDGVPMSDPTALYRRGSLQDVVRIQAIPPAEAAGVFGSAVNGVVLIETRFAPTRTAGYGPPPPRTGFVAERSAGFDWSQDPAGHSFGRTFVGALIGNAAGLAAGLAVGRQCVFIEDRTQDIEFSCGNAGVAGAGFAAVTLPALGSALGANLMGRTDLSEGRLVPSMVGGMMGAVPGYIFALATVGEGVQTMNTVGKGFLILAPPLLTTVADRLFRELR